MTYECVDCGIEIIIPTHKTFYEDKEVFLCKGCYDYHTKISREGLPSGEDINNNLYVRKEYEESLGKYLLSLKKYIQGSKVSQREVLNRVLSMEEQASIILFSKGRSVLSYAEHLAVILKVGEDIGLERFSDECINSSSVATGSGKFETAYKGFSISG